MENREIPSAFFETLVTMLPELQQMHRKTVVIKYGGNAMTNATLKREFARDLVFLKMLGMRVVIVHGGGPQIAATLEKIGHAGHFAQGMRVTDETTLSVVISVLAGQVQQEIVNLINHHGSYAIGVTGQDGDFIRAQKMQLAKLELGFVGEVLSVNPLFLDQLHANGYIPVISPLAADAGGQTLNINADVVAGKVALAINADTLLMMTNIAGVQDAQGNLLRHITEKHVKMLIKDGTISGGMLPKISAALDAVALGVETVHIIDGRTPHVLLQTLLTKESTGTVITTHSAH